MKSWRWTLTVTPLRAVLALAMVVVVASGAATAFAAIGDDGVVQACYDSGGNVKLTPTLPCPKGFTYVGQLYTKAGADALFLTKAAAGETYVGKTGTAANADKLDGKDSSEFMLADNCVGYPRVDIDWHACELSFANLDKAGLIDADLSEATLFNASLVGANLLFADLSGAHMLLADLRGADLRSADLTGTDLTEVNLLGARFSNATVTGVDWHRATCPDGTYADDQGFTCEGHLTP